MPELHADNFDQRVDYAARCILNQETRSREFDSCFEMYDGDLVAAAIVKRCEQNPDFHAALANWQSGGRSSELPADWLAAADKFKHVSDLAEEARRVREAAEQEAQARFSTMQAQQAFGQLATQ